MSAIRGVMAAKVRREYRQSYPAHHETVQAWGECVWTARDELLRAAPLLRVAQGFALEARAVAVMFERALDRMPREG